MKNILSLDKDYEVKMRSFGGKRSGEKRTMAAQKSEAGTKVLGKRSSLKSSKN
jgi:hypothetical protein